MENTEPVLKKPVRSESEIAIQIADLISKYSDDMSENNSQFRELVIQYFKKESLTIEANIMPHLDRKFRDSDESLREILEKDDKEKLKELIHNLVTESLEDAFKEKDVKYDELKVLADQRLKRARYALITVIATGVLGAITTFLGVYFGRN